MYEGKICIVRGENSGVFFGTVAAVDGRTVELQDVRCLWEWYGAEECLQLALEGTNQPDMCKFTVVVPSMVLLDVVEIVPCSDAAITNLSNVRIWKV